MCGENAISPVPRCAAASAVTQAELENLTIGVEIGCDADVAVVADDPLAETRRQPA